MSGPLFVARRLFLRRRRDHRQGHPLVGAALGIALSLVPLITVDHVADAMIEGIIARYRETSTFQLQVRSWGTPDRDEWEQMRTRLAGRDDLADAWIERQGFGLARAGASREGLTLRALPADLDRRNPAFSGFLSFDSGAWDLDDPESILLGREAARRLGASAGDEIRVLTARRLNDGRYVPRVSRFTVRGVFSSGYQDLDSTWAFIPLDSGWTILSDESSRTLIGASHADPDTDTRRASAIIGASLPDRWTAYDWRELNRYLLGNLESTRDILLFIMALIIIVAVSNVLSSLVMLTLERQREIGILKCTGASPRQITRTFVAAGLLASLAGTLAGLGGGVLVARFINEIIAGVEAVLNLFGSRNGEGIRLLDEGYYLQYIPIRMRWTATAVIGAATFLLSLGASAIPASRAARLKPLEVLRKH